MDFFIVPRRTSFPEEGRDRAYLRVDHWDDFSFVTMFSVMLHDENGISFELGAVKIGFRGQAAGTATFEQLPSLFQRLPAGFFSLGQDVNYYHLLGAAISQSCRESYLSGLRDVVYDQTNMADASGERVFGTSLLRYISMPQIDGQFRRVLSGGALLTDYDFGFHRPDERNVAGIDLKFSVLANSTPSTNIHALIGRNGVGKTTLLNKMTIALVQPGETGSRFFTEESGERVELDSAYFSGVISISFSAFDPFLPPQEQNDPEHGTRYNYIGLKDLEDESGTILKSLSALRKECVDSIVECFSDNHRRTRWRVAIETLESDENFARMELPRMLQLAADDVAHVAARLVDRMSSGHAVVLLTISRLVAKVEEKTLILLDEPESHLHPPLLSAFTRALSELLRNRNGVALVATHSPVVLQEVPKSCVTVLTRSGLSMHSEQPRIETFGENVGILTREVFGLEVVKSGFHALLKRAAASGGSYEELVSEYDGQLGLEARGILRAMIAERDSGSHEG